MLQWSDCEQLDVTIEEQSSGHSDQNSHHCDPEHRQKDLSDWSLVTGPVEGGGRESQKITNSVQSTQPSSLQEQITIQSSFKQTPHEPLCFFRRAPAWSDAQTHTNSWRAKVVVSDRWHRC